jgi:hypothetical protein
MAIPQATNSGYAGLVQAGMQAMAALATKPDTSAVYNRAYGQAMQKRNALEVQHKGEHDITSARLRGVKQRTALAMNQDVVEANIRANAAVAGVKGGNIGDNIYQTKANEAFRTADQAVDEGNTIEQALQKVYGGAQASRVPVDNYSGSTVGAVMTGLSSGINSFDREGFGLALEEDEGVAKQDYKVDHYDPSR